MKIAVISSTVFSVGSGGLTGYGGLEQLAWQQARGLAKKGHDVLLIAPDGSHCEGGQVFHTGPPAGHDEKTAYEKYWKHLPQFDAIIDNSWQKWAHCLREEGVLKSPVLAVCHAPIHTMFQQLPPAKLLSFVCISEDQRAHFEALFSRSARTCYNGVDGDFYKPIPGVKRSKRFLFLARFSSIKGPLLAIRACRKAGVGLDLVGDMQITQEPDYAKACMAECDGEQIRMVGNASRGQCVRWFSQAHAMIHPNFPEPASGHAGFREPFGLAPVEAMLCGCPVIAGDYGAMRETVPRDEFVTDAPSGLVNSMDELVEAVKHFAKREVHPEQRENLRTLALRFSIDRMVSRYEALCKEARTAPW